MMREKAPISNGEETMPGDIKETTKRATSSGVTFAYCAWSGRSSQNSFDDFYRMATDDLHVLGIDLQLEELKKSHELTKERFLQIFTDIKSHIIVTLERSYDQKVAGWFELSFFLSFIAIAPTASDRTNLISIFEKDVKRVAIQAGYPEARLKNILRSLQSNVPVEALIDLIRGIAL